MNNNMIVAAYIKGSINLINSIITIPNQNPANQTKINPVFPKNPFHQTQPPH